MAWRPGSPKPNPAQVLKSPYIAGWPRPGDGGVVAEMGQPVGAAWFRLLPGESPGYGFIDEQTPEISIGVEARWRGRGIGRLLLTALCDTARAEAFESLCLSVEVDNYALGLYRVSGFPEDHDGRQRLDDGNSSPPRRQGRPGTGPSGRSMIKGMTTDEIRARFRSLHGDGLFLMPNPHDLGSCRLLTTLGFEALATTSAGFAASLGQRDMTVTREQLVDHVRSMSSVTHLPINVDAEQCFPDSPGGVAATVEQLADAGAAGCSIEDWNPRTKEIEDLAVAAAPGCGRGGNGRETRTRPDGPGREPSPRATTTSRTRSGASPRTGSPARTSPTPPDSRTSRPSAGSSMSAAHQSMSSCCPEARRLINSLLSESGASLSVAFWLLSPMEHCSTRLSIYESQARWTPPPPT